MNSKPENINIRLIRENDNIAIASIIRSSLKEFGADKKGTAYYEDTTDNLFQLFEHTKGSVYFIAENKDQILGGGGIFPSAGLPEHTCELVKMYLLPQARGLGLGKILIQKCIDFAKEKGYEYMYIETMPELKQALPVYEKLGFHYINGPMGNTGHFACELFMLKKL